MKEKFKIPFLSKVSFLKNKDSELIRNKKIIYTIAIVVLLIIALSIFEQLFGIISVTFWGDSIIKQTTSEIKILQRQIEREQSNYRDILSRESQIIQNQNQYWVPARDGNVKEKYQDKLNTVARNSNVELNTTGTVQLNKVGEGISVGDLEISCSGNMEGIVKFLYYLTNATPKLYWDRFALRPDNYNNPNVIYLSGEVKFIQIDNKNIVSLFNKKQ